MPPIISKKEMSEEDIKLHYITPTIQPTWNEYMTMETFITDGQILLRGNKVSRGEKCKIDYLLYIFPNNPIAVVEAKDNTHLVSDGMQQAKKYAQMLDLPFAYSSNGDAFQEFDFFTGKERTLALEDFPTHEELIERYKTEKNGGHGLSEAEAKILAQPYFSAYGSETPKEPRYYQRLAINRTLEAIAQGHDRILLVMATGTGKTYTAFQIAYRLLKSGLKRKVLYLADRNNLVDQSIEQDFAPLENVIHKVDFSADNPTTITAYQMYFSLYQQLSGNGTETSVEEETARYSQLFSPDFFDLIIVDECHRGSAKEDSRWRAILEYFHSATQIGMTATPKENSTISNIDYFGNPVYTYSLKQGIEDGFLAPFRVINITSNISDGWRPTMGQKDIYGLEIEDRIYNNSDYDYNIIIQDRINMVASEITRYLKATDRMAKTIVFCATEDAAERMRVALTNENADMVQKNPDYVVRITGSDKYGKEKLDYFISVSQPYPVIATTSKLLSTGADCKMVKLIVLDQMIGSMTEFKQIIGRGTRIREKEGKTHFMIMDFRNVTRLFADPDWDGPIEQDDNFHHLELSSDPQPPEPPPPKQRYTYEIDKTGCQVEIFRETVAVYNADGKLLRQENIIDYTKANILNDYASLEQFIANWNASDKKAIIKKMLDDRGIDLEKLKAEQKMEDVDDFDFICHLAYDQKPLTRAERANNVKKRDFLAKYSGVAREILEALLEKYKNAGIYELENTEILKIDPLKTFGAPAKIVGYFGGKEGYLQAIKELENELYRVA